MSAFDIGKLSMGAAGAAALIALLAGCASSGSSSSNSPSTAVGAGAASTLKTTSTPIGTVLVDPAGKTVYELVGDTTAKPTCAADCLKFWPPVMVNGSQVVVNGHPAYTYVKDTAAGQTTGQNVTDKWGKWLALDASGNPITASAGASSPAATTSAPSGGGPAF